MFKLTTCEARLDRHMQSADWKLKLVKGCIEENPLPVALAYSTGQATPMQDWHGHRGIRHMVGWRSLRWITW